MPSSELVTDFVRSVLLSRKGGCKLPAAESPLEWQGECSVMSFRSTFRSSSIDEQLDSRSSSKHHFSRSFSTSCEEDSQLQHQHLIAATDHRRFSLDDVLDEKEEDVKRASSLSRLLEGGVRVEHRSRDFVRQSSRTSSTETMSSGDKKCFFSRKKTETSSSLSSLTKEVTISAKSTSSNKSSQSAQNLNQSETNDSKGKASQITQIFHRSKQPSPSPMSPSRPPQPPKPQPQDKQMEEDLQLLRQGSCETPERELALGRLVVRMDALGDALRVASSKGEADGAHKAEVALLETMNELIRKAWAVSTVGYDLGSSLCKSLKTRGVLDILIQNLSSECTALQFESARLLEQSLTTENRQHVVAAGLTATVRGACSLARKGCPGAGILEHLFKGEPAVCTELIRLGALAAVLYECRSSDVETLRHCAAALANLSLHGGPENQEAMIQHKAPEWLFPLAFHDDDEIQYYACLSIAALVANKEIEAAVLRSGTLDLVEPFVTSHTPEAFGASSPQHVHGQSRDWLQRLVPLLNSQREEAMSLAAFHFAMEAGIKKRQGNSNLFHDIGVVGALKKVASCPNAIASKYAAQALTLIGEQVPHKLTQQVPLWTVEDVVEWVKQIGFSRYSQEFMSSKVDGDLLLQLCEQSLANDIGMTNGILRRRFLRELNLLKRLADYSSCDSTGLGAFLQSLGPEFCQYTYQMIQSGVRMCNLRCLSEEQLQTECAIHNSIHRMRLLHAVKASSARNSILQPEEELDPKSLDVFISYRRASGSLLASLLKVHLQLRNFSVFLDVEKLEAGKFDNNLLNSVRQAKHFILVLTPSALDRCVSDIDHKDWVHREIVEALNSQCNIIPVLDNFQWPEPETLPEDMRAISYFNGVSWIHDYQEACVDKIERFMRGELNVRTDGPIGRHLNLGGCGTPTSPGGSSLPRMLAHNSFQRSDSNE